MKNIGIVNHSIFMIAGHVRQGLTIADALKSLGYNVKIYTREPKRKSYTITLKYTTLTISVGGTIQFFNLSDLKKYYPLKYLSEDDIVIREMPPIHPYIVGFSGLEKIYDENDIVLTLEELYVYFATYFDAKRTISYIHFPSVAKPADFPARLWTNSTYTMEAIVSRWNVDKKLIDIVYPSIHLDLYKYRDVSEREYDIVVFSRLTRDKLIWFDKLVENLRGYKIALAGSDFGYVPKAKVDTFINISFKEVADLLSRSKIYVHMRGYRSDPEHFGIAPLEAMASGCVPVVHMSGGTWIDVVGRGKYGIGYNTPEEAISKIKDLLSNEEKLAEFSLKARERAKYFSFEKMRETLDKKIKNLFDF